MPHTIKLNVDFFGFGLGDKLGKELLCSMMNAERAAGNWSCRRQMFANFSEVHSPKKLVETTELEATEFKGCHNRT